MKRIFLLLFLFFFVTVVYGDSKTQQWRQDLQFLAKRLPEVHANAFHKISRTEFESAVQSLNDRIPSLTSEQIIVELMRIVAMIGDGHTSLSPLFDPSIGFHYYPLRLYLFRDGLYVEKADPENEDVVGARLVAIGETPVEEAWKAS